MSLKCQKHDLVQRGVNSGGENAAMRWDIATIGPKHAKDFKCLCIAATLNTSFAFKIHCWAVTDFGKIDKGVRNISRQLVNKNKGDIYHNENKILGLLIFMEERDLIFWHKFAPNSISVLTKIGLSSSKKSD